MTTLEHPQLGTVRGKPSEGVLQFLGVKYASLKDRFAPAQLIAGYPEGTVPAAPSPPNGCDDEYMFIQHTLPKPNLTQSDIDCLHVNITVPYDGLGEPCSGTKLPVLIFIHGGGFAVGANSWPQYDLAKLVQFSARIGSPVIGIGVNSRLGVCGFLTSEELRSAGYQPNNGLRDQRVAFEWVAKHIAGFGGDPDNVTVIGESAGAVSVALHLQSQQALFHRAVCMSGTSLMRSPLPLSVADSTYDAMMQILGLADLTRDERIAALLSIPFSEIVAKTPFTLPIMPVVDQDIIPKALTFEDLVSSPPAQLLGLLPGRKWCRELMLGDCEMDSHIYSYMLHPRLSPEPGKPDITTAFKTSLSRSLGQETAERILEAYNIPSSQPSSSTTEALRPILAFANDICFFVPALVFDRAWCTSSSALPDSQKPQPRSSHLYHFNAPNPWPGPWQGHATHILDVAFLFMNFTQYMTPEQRQVGERFAADVIRFASGTSGGASGLTQAEARAGRLAAQKKDELEGDGDGNGGGGDGDGDGEWATGGAVVYGPSGADATDGDDAATTRSAMSSFAAPGPSYWTLSRRRNTLLRFQREPGWDALIGAWTAFLIGG